jgi:hypothetical protein
MIRPKTALRIASEWYSGDGSALYMVSCGRFEKMRPEDFLRAAIEIYCCNGTNKAEKRDLRNLYQFLVARGSV